MQDDLPIKSALAHELFPGRAMLRIGEIAQAWGCDEQHVRNLIECGDLPAIDIKTSAPAKPSDIASEPKHRSVRQWLRIPVSAFDTFTKSRVL